jgi:CDK-activating kinase assembly factor MAT1
MNNNRFFAIGQLASVSTDSDVFDGCTECRTRTVNDPQLQLRFSRCCGWKVCTTCIRAMFGRTGNASIQCKSCGEFIKNTFEKQNFNMQQFNAEKKSRDRMEREFQLHRLDFEADAHATGQSITQAIDLYNNYLELVEDVVFDLAYGTRDEQKIAWNRWLEYGKQHNDQIKRSQARHAQRDRERRARVAAIAAKEMEREREREREQRSNSDTEFKLGQPPAPGPIPGQGQNQDTQSMLSAATARLQNTSSRTANSAASQLPQPIVSMASVAEAIDESKLSEKERTLLHSRRRRAGGFRPDDCDARDYCEAMSALFLGI